MQTARGVTENNGINWNSLGTNQWLYSLDERNWALFSVVPEPHPVTGMLAALVSLAVLRRRRATSQGWTSLRRSGRVQD